MPVVNVHHQGTPPCGEGSLPFRGETYHLYLNQRYFSSDVTAPISAVFQKEIVGAHGKKVYQFSYDSSSLPPGVAALSTCHVHSIVCLKGCCGESLRQIAALKAELTALREQVNSGNVINSFCSGRTLITQFADGSVVATPSATCVPRGGVPCEQTLCIDMVDGGLYHFRSLGGLTVNDLMAVGSAQFDIFKGGSGAFVVDAFTEDPTNPNTDAYNTLTRLYAAEAIPFAGITEGWKNVADGNNDWGSYVLPEYFRVQIGEGKAGTLCIPDSMEYYYGSADQFNQTDLLTYATLPWVLEQSAGAPGTTCS